MIYEFFQLYNRAKSFYDYREFENVFVSNWMEISYHFLDHKSRRVFFLNNSVSRNVRMLKSRPQNFSFLSSKIFNTNACTSGFGLIRTFLREKRSECTAYNEARYKRSRELSNAIKCGSV